MSLAPCRRRAIVAAQQTKPPPEPPAQAKPKRKLQGKKLTLKDAG